MALNCASAKVTSKGTNSWIAPGSVRGDYVNIVVIALVGTGEWELQQKTEDKVVEDLQKRGYNATSFFMLNGPYIPDKTNEAVALAKLRKANADAVLTIALLVAEKEKRYDRSSLHHVPLGYYQQFWDYYLRQYDRVYGSGYYTANTNYFWESNLYTNCDEQLRYTVRTMSFKPKSTNSAAAQYSREIVDDMVTRNVLRKNSLSKEIK